MKAIIKYPGSKWNIAKWIISFFPEHHSYVELFAGSLAVLFNKRRSNIETVNDLDGDVVNFFEWVQKDPERLAHAVYFTPYARQVFEKTFETQFTDSFEKAVIFCIKLNMGHCFRTNGEKTGWKNDIQGREKAYAAMDWKSFPERIIQAAERLRGVQIENRPAVELMERFNYKNVLFYIDPPYILETRHGKQYKCEMEKIEQHEELLDTALKHEGPCLISHYEHPLYQEKLKGWHREETFCYTQSRTQKKEILYMNFEPEKQMSFEDYKKGEWKNDR